MRRQILRALHDSPVPLSGTQLLRYEGLESSLSSVTFHVLVLAESGAVRVIPPATGDDRRAFASAVAEDLRVTTLLAVTDEADQDYFANRPDRRD